MDEKQIARMFEQFELDEAKRDAFARFAQQGPLRLEPEQPADFSLDCMTLSDDEDAFAELA